MARSHPRSWNVSAVPPVMTTSTTPTRMPVRTSICRYGRRRCSAKVATPTAAVPQADRKSLERHATARLRLQGLEEQHHLDALSVDAREAERHEPERGGQPGHRQETASLAMVAADPSRPIHLVDEPIENQEQYDDREEARDRLEPRAQRRSEAQQRVDREPRRDRATARNQRSGHHGAPPRAVGAQEAGGDRGEDQDRLETFPEDDDCRVQDDRPVALGLRHLGRVDKARLRRCHQVYEERYEREPAQPPGQPPSRRA